VVSFRYKGPALLNVALKLKSILRTWFFGIAVVGSAAAVCVGQQLSFATLTEGLGNLNVKCLAQDRSGYLWVGTENGLYRYDGRVFRQFGTPEGLNGHIIQSLFASPEGTLFVGTTTGIYFERQDGSFSAIHPPAPVTDFSQRIGTVFTALAPGQVVTADRSGPFLLRRLDADTWTAEPMHLDGKAIWSVLAGPGGVLWYGCDDDLCRLENGKTTHLRTAWKLPEEQWAHLRMARDGHIWMRGTMHVGEAMPQEGRYEERDLPGPSNASSYVDLTDSGDGRMVASQGASFGVWDHDGWRMVTAANGLSRYEISALFADREGSLWIGVVGHGLMRWVGQHQWEAYTAANGLGNDIVWATLRDREGRLWIGTESGLDTLAPGSTTPHPLHSPEVDAARVDSLAEGADGSIWADSAGRYLLRIDPKTLKATKWKVPEVFRLLTDGPRLWAATDRGLYEFDESAGDLAPRLVTSVDLVHPEQRCTDLSLDKKKRLWLATDNGIYRLNQAGWQQIDPGLSGLTPTYIAADDNGNLWAAGAFPGVVRLRIDGRNVVESEHVVRPHLLSEQIVSLAVDHRGWVWVGQDAGVSVFDGASWRSFTQDDGLVWNDVDSYALAEDTDGSMWIGTSGGLSHMIHPQTAQAAPPAPPVFSQVAFGATPIGDKANVPWSESPLAVTMAALTFRDASHALIRYRLLGVETEWVQTAERSVRYPRLEPGAYKFEALVVDGATGAVSSPAEFSFVIAPQWWQSSPLRLALVLVIALTVLLAWRWSLQLLVRQKRHLEAAVHRRTEDLEREKAELLRTREQMRHFAEHDDLTGLWNHRIVIERLRQEVDRSRREKTPLSVILVDLDHFKRVNDTHGHPAGDLVLKEVAAIFQAAVRSYDWVGRYGGEEFLLIFPGSGFTGARQRAEQLRLAVQAAHIHDGHTAIPVTASFGVASGFPANYEVLIHSADTALYRAKDNGRNCVMATELHPEEDDAA